MNNNKKTPLMFDYHLQQTEAKWSCHQLLCKPTEKTVVSRLNENIEFGPAIWSQQKRSRPPSSGAPQSADFKSLWRVGLASEYVITLWVQAHMAVDERVDREGNIYICTFVLKFLWTPNLNASIQSCKWISFACLWQRSRDPRGLK